jgi:Uma2 family endonuclease
MKWVGLQIMGIGKMATVEKLVTAGEFFKLPDNGQVSELVRGKIIVMNVPGFRHGEICGNVVHYLGSYARDRGIGRVLSNDTGVVTAKDPDTVRGADVAFYSFVRVPKGSQPSGYPDVAPELVIEVLSPNDRWPEITAKVGEYLAVGVLAVCLLDPQSRTVTVHHADRPPDKLTQNDELRLPEILPGFAVGVARLFE